MIRVLFVDDESHVLESLRDALRPWRRELTMAFADDGPSALDELAREPYHAVVSDMRMPGMDGAELLREVQRVQPATVQIVLSGYAEIESAARAATVAHRFLSKPCDAGELVSVINRSCAINALVEQEERGFTHADVGAHLLGLWGLPPAIVEAVAHHHRPAAAHGPTMDATTAVHVASVLADERILELDMDEVEGMGVSDQVVARWREIAAAEQQVQR